MDKTTIKRIDGKIQIVELQEVVKEEYSIEQLKQELEAINSEIKNFDLIQERRMTTLLDRKEKLEGLLI